MRRVSFKVSFILLFAVTTLQFAFLNCSRRSVTFEQVEKTSVGGGDGYSGKLYVIQNSNGACADGSPYRAEIKTTASNQGVLLREDCTVIAPKSVDVLISSIDSDLLAYDLTVFREDVSLGVIAKAPTVLAALGMQSSVASNRVCAGADCFKFDSDGTIAEQVDFSAAGEYEFRVLARADVALGVGASMELKIDGANAGTATVASANDAEYAFRANVPIGRHEIAIAFTNDYQDGVANRNLYVVSVAMQEVAVSNSICLSRSAGALLTLDNSQMPYLNRTLAAETRIDAQLVSYLGTATSPMKLGGGANSCIAGGSIEGAWSLSASHSTVSGTFGLNVNSPNFLVENFRNHNYGNCLGLWDNAYGFDVRGAYCTQTRGDFISNKNGWSGTVQDSLFDGGSVFFNDRDSAAAPVGSVTTLRNNLVRLQRFDQTYWGTPGHGWFWKQDATASAVKLRLHGNILMAEEASLNSDQLDASTILSCKKADGSPDNIIVWLGAGAYPRPAELATGCFTLTTDRAVWDQAVADWKSRHGY